MKLHLPILLLALLAAAMAGACDMSPSITEVKHKHEAQLLKMAGVVSVGIGLDKNGREVIVIGLDAPNPETEAQLPAQLEGFAVRVQTVGPIRAR